MSSKIFGDVDERGDGAPVAGCGVDAKEFLGARRQLGPAESVRCVKVERPALQHETLGRRFERLGRLQVWFLGYLGQKKQVQTFWVLGGLRERVAGRRVLDF